MEPHTTHREGTRMAISEDELTRDELEGMTVAELREYAAERDISLPSGATKGEIVTKIECADDGAEDGPTDANGDGELSREDNEDLQARSVIDDPPASGGSIATTDERMTRISADNVEQAPKDQWIDYVSQGEDSQQSVQAAVLYEPIFLEWGDPEEHKLEAGDYIVRDGDGNLSPCKKSDFTTSYAKPEPDVPDKEVQDHPAVNILQRTIQLFTERPGDGSNIAQVYQWADEAGVDLRGHQASGSAVKE